MIVITGAYGFIGSNLVHYLNSQGVTDLILVDDLTDGIKYKNLLGAQFKSYYDVDEFFTEFKDWTNVTAVYHQGAVSSTTETNGKIVMDRNYSFSCKIFDHVIKYQIPISYASSASVYGNTSNYSIDPLNLYAYSKSLVDEVVERNLSSFKRVHGWRYYNVYGNRETHKENQASPITKFSKQARTLGRIEIFEGSNDIYRDFVAVDDVIKVITKFINEQKPSSIRDLGLGRSESFATVAYLVSRKFGDVPIVTVPFPESLKSGYQYLTRARPLPEYKFISLTEWLYKNNI